MADSFEEQVADELEADETPEIEDEKAIKPDRCPKCGKFAQVAETRIRKRGTEIVEIFDCGHRRDRG